MIEKEKSLGQYFTPDFIATFMTSLIGIDMPKTASILEPCAGEGIFLKYLKDKHFSNITAYEIDSTIQNESKVKIQYTNFLTKNMPNKFDVIISNPPYVRWKNIPDELKIDLKTNPYWKDKINGLGDLLYAFIIHSIESLKENGELIFITPMFWTETQHSWSVRNYFVQNGVFELIITFDEMSIFPGVSSSIMIFKYIKHKPELDKEIKIIKVLGKERVDPGIIEKIKNILGTLDTSDSISEPGLEAFKLKQFSTENTWKFIPKQLQSAFSNIEHACVSNKKMKELPYVCLGDVADIGNGMVSGLDIAFKVEDSQGYPYTDEEKKYFIKVIKGQHLTQYFAEKETDYIFIREKISEEFLQSKLPNIYNKLVAHRDQLEQRYDYDKNDLKWWEWVFLRNIKLIERNDEKILVPCKDRVDKRQHIRFAYAKGKLYATQDVTSIVKKSTTKESIFYLLALLNSDLLFTWIKHNGISRGGVLEFSERPLSQIPIRMIDWSNDTERKIHDEITELVQAIIQTKQIEPNKNTLEVLVRNLYGVH